MDVSCPACAARYTADDEKLRGKTARMRCKACNTVWLVSGPGATSAAASAISTPPPASVIPAPAQSAPPASSDKRAAVVKTGAEREKRDLFAADSASDGSGFVKDTLLPPPSFGFNSGVGARNENSVLFRVDQLAAAARLKTPEPSLAPKFESSASSLSSAPSSASPSSLSGSDEGVIDLKALSTAPPALRPMPMIVAPLFSEPPGVSLDINDTRSPGGAKKKNNTMLYGMIAAAAVFLLVTGFGISFAFKSEEPIKHTAAVAVAPPPAAPTAAPAPTPEPPPPATASDDDHKDTKKKGGGKKGKGKAAKGGGGGGNQTASTPPKVKPADPCGCKGDFNCILACTAKGGK